ncbi:MAG: class F sortase [Propionibacteriaceae bacterium]|nr:class F sortase [Propionibacteriaceae bacterium]
MPILKNRAVQVLLGLVVVAMIVVGALFVLRPGGAPQTAAPVTAAPGADVTDETMDTMEPVEPSNDPGATSTAPATPTAGAQGNETCTNYTGDMESPTKFVIERMGVESPMMVVGKDAQGNPGAPPPNQGYTTAWYNGSPAPGTTQGNVILTIHTYSKGQALGNDLYGKNGLQEGTGGLREGDLIKISDAEGNQVCYRYTRDHKVWVSTYDPESGVFFNPDGPPQLAIMICWDYVPSTNDWDSRIIFYAELIPEGQRV